MVYGFAFTDNNASTKTLYKLNSVDHRYILWGNNIEHYLDLLLHDQPESILGLGVYSGIDQDQIRIETQVTNKFRNDPIDPKLTISEMIPLNPYLKPIDGSKFTSGLGNSWCNLVSWKIVNLINQKLLKSRYTFLHIPNKFPVQQSAMIIEGMLN